MASLQRTTGGRYVIQFVGIDNRRKTLAAGNSLKHARTLCSRIESLLSSRIRGAAVDRDVAVWLRGIGDKLHARLATFGLVAPRANRQTTLAAFIDDYLETRGDVKPGTMAVMQQARRHLVGFLGEDTALPTITPADADRFRADLLAKGRARATVSKWCYYGRHFLEQAKRANIIEVNPFGHLRGQVRGNTARRVFVSAEDVQKVIDTAPDPQWKLLIALARWGGLRIPSEALALTWRDVDFERCGFTVRSSKTEHHDSGGVRPVPMFPELVRHFQAVFDAAPEGSEYVISRYRSPAANLRTQLVRYIEAAGLTAWPKPWQNLRASRATELADQYAGHVCATWLGHSEKIADEFYRTVTDEHFARAIRGDVTEHTTATRGAAETLQQPTADKRNALHDITADDENTGVSSPCDSKGLQEVGAAGIELPANSPEKRCKPSGSAAETLQLATRHDPRLARIVHVWPTLSEHQRELVCRLVFGGKAGEA